MKYKFLLVIIVYLDACINLNLAFYCCRGQFTKDEVGDELHLCNLNPVNSQCQSDECLLTYNIRKGLLHNATQMCNTGEEARGETLLVPAAAQMCQMKNDDEYDWMSNDGSFVIPSYTLHCTCNKPYCNEIRSDIIELWKNAVELHRRMLAKTSFDPYIPPTTTKPQNAVVGAKPFSQSSKVVASTSTSKKITNNGSSLNFISSTLSTSSPITNNKITNRPVTTTTNKAVNTTRIISIENDNLSRVIEIDDDTAQTWHGQENLTSTSVTTSATTEYMPQENKTKFSSTSLPTIITVTGAITELEIKNTSKSTLSTMSVINITSTTNELWTNTTEDSIIEELNATDAEDIYTQMKGNITTTTLTEFVFNTSQEQAIMAQNISEDYIENEYYQQEQNIIDETITDFMNNDTTKLYVPTNIKNVTDAVNIMRSLDTTTVYKASKVAYSTTQSNKGSTK